MSKKAKIVTDEELGEVEVEDIGVNENLGDDHEIDVSVHNEQSNDEGTGTPVGDDVSNALSESVSLSDLKKKRQYVRMRLTKIYNVIKDSRYISDNMKDLYRDKLGAIRGELTSLDADIFVTMIGITDDEDSPPCRTEMIESSEYERKIDVSLCKLRENDWNNVNANVTDNPFNSPPNRFPVTNKLKLPEIALPEYSNSKSCSLERFLYSFESIIDKHSLSPYEKFVYLRGQLRGAPRILIDSLDSSEQSYDSAVELLTEAFASTITQKYDAISRLSQLKLNINGDPYRYVGEMRTLSSTLENLKIDVEDIFQYFVWSGLNDRFQSILIQITNNSKPNINQIQSHMFEAVERYVKLNERINDSKNKRANFTNNFPKANHSSNNYISDQTTDTNNLAVNIGRNSFIPCHLCVSDKARDVSHTMKNCPKYTSAIAKVNKLEKLKFCSRCSFKNHSTKECKFKFTSNCYHCKGDHMSFLCKNQDCRREITENKVSWIQNMRVDSHDDTLLPSFMAPIVQGDNVTLVRALRDSGSQRNFVTEDICNRLSLPTATDNLDLKINGFNSPRYIRTKSVHIPIDFGYTVSTIEAVVVPEMSLELYVPEAADVAREFLDRGYELADPGLAQGSSPIDNFGLILGASSDSLLKTTTAYYGDDHASYMNSSLGVILYGAVNTLLSSIKDLPYVTDNGSNVNDGTDNTIPQMHLSTSVDVGDIMKDSVKENECNANVTMVELLNECGDANIDKLKEITEDALDIEAEKLLNYDLITDQEGSELNAKLINHVLQNTERLENGRLCMPLTWNWDIKHLLGTNYNMSKSILYSNIRKISQSNEKLQMYNNVFREQEERGIIQRIENVEEFVEQHPEASFLPHMGVFRLDKETSKCRVVFLSNLCERNDSQPNALSHNQVLQAGPSLNHKLSTAIILSRFDKYMLSFDVEKAFLGISLRETDQLRLCFLWYRAIERNDYTIIGYKNLRLSFGLRPSPAILMLGLYYMLILNVDNNSDRIVDLKKRVYNTVYMDNCSISDMSGEYIQWAYSALIKIFGEYQFALQQFSTNYKPMQNVVSDANGEPEVVKYFGMQWHTDDDMLCPNSPRLDPDAKTKRSILSSLNSVFDPFNVYIPILNRAKLFFQELQLDKSLSWDTVLSDDRLREWRNIVRQVNATPLIKLDRCVGARDSCYDLIAFTDASNSIYGVVVYIRDINTNSVNFLLAKSKVINNLNCKKSIPSLECQALSYGTEVLLDLYKELTGTDVVIPVNVRHLKVYTDSMVNLHWLSSYFLKYDKMQRRTPYVMNRLESIKNLCSVHPVVFSHISGSENPGDCTTRALSYDKLRKSCYLSGPDFLLSEDTDEDFQITVPNPITQISDEGTESACREEAACTLAVASAPPDSKVQHLVPMNRYSCFYKTVRVYRYVIMFVKKCREKINGGKKFGSANLYETSINKMISIDQQLHYPDVFEFLRSKCKAKANIPNLVMQMNLVLDEHSVIRVKGKFSHGNYPILLHYDSLLTKLIVENTHHNSAHVGLYSTLRTLRQTFWIQRGFSTVRKILKQCITCRRVNERPVKTNQNCYKEFRSSPPEIPFSYIFIDHMGPFKVRFRGTVSKVYILVITCLWSRAIDLKLCYSLDVAEFLRAMQTHVYEYGLFQLCLSDLGSQITSGAKIIQDHLDEPEVTAFFDRHGAKYCKFEHYAKGNSSLGSLVEVCVKQTKRLISKSIKTNVLEFGDFQLLISKVSHIINRRPVSFRESLREYDAKESIPDCVTPEQLIRGYELISLDIVPQMRLREDLNFDEFSPLFINDKYAKFQRVHTNLIKRYNEEFLVELMTQAISERDKYKPVLHKTLQIGDVVLLVEPMTKQINYPMGIIQDIKTNSFGEVVSAYVLKGRTRERVFRHSSSLILLLKCDDSQINPNANRIASDCERNINKVHTVDYAKPRRKAAARSQSVSRSLIKEGLV